MVAVQPWSKKVREALPRDKDGAYLDLSGQLSVIWEEAGKRVTANLTKFPDVSAQTITEDMDKSGRHSSRVDPDVTISRETRARLMRTFVAKVKNGELRRIAASGLSDFARVVRKKLIGLATENPKVLLKAADMTGAGVLHCLLLANTTESLDLAMDLVRYCPRLLQIVHVENGGPLCFFKGEGPLHIAAVNMREKWILQALEIAWACGDHMASSQPPTPSAGNSRRLLSSPVSRRRGGTPAPSTRRGPGQRTPRAKGEAFVRELLAQTCEGGFFSTPPMSTMGGTAIAYCAVFNQTAVLRWCASKFRDDRPFIEEFFTARPVPRGGAHTPDRTFSVLQAIVYNGARAAYDTLVGSGIRIRPSEVPRDHGLTPKRLAAKIGKAELFEHLLSSSKVPMWVWGPVSSYMIDMIEIDTAFAESPKALDGDSNAYTDPQVFCPFQSTTFQMCSARSAICSTVAVPSRAGAELSDPRERTKGVASHAFR